MRGLFFVYFRCLFFASEFDPAHRIPGKKTSKKPLFKRKIEDFLQKKPKPFSKRKKERKSESGRSVLKARGAGREVMGSNRQDKSNRRKKDNRGWKRTKEGEEKQIMGDKTGQYLQKTGQKYPKKAQTGRIMGENWALQKELEECVRRIIRAEESLEN